MQENLSTQPSALNFNLNRANFKINMLISKNKLR